MGKKNSRVCAVIDLKAIMANLELMHRNLPEETRICAVIKTNAYGHGAVEIAHYIENQPYLWGYAVATAHEAQELREAGICKPVLILGYVFEEDMELLVRLDVRAAVFTEEMAELLDRYAAEAGKILPIHLALDTGMSRIGLADNEEGLRIAASISKMKNLRIEGLFTHFARADEEDKSNALEAFCRYNAFYEKLKAQGIEVAIRHAANSAAIEELPQTALDMARAGITLYGIYPSDEMNRSLMKLHPAMELKSHISYIKTVPAGTPVSYGGTYVTKKETAIATIPVGYGDGYPRSLSNKGCVLIGGRRAPILGRVCMDQFMVDVTGIEAMVHQEVTLMGKDGDDEITVDELSVLSGRFPYEFVCDLSLRIPRVYKS